MKNLAVLVQLARCSGLTLVLIGASLSPAFAIDSTPGLSSTAFAVVQYTFNNVTPSYSLPAGLSPGLNDFRDFKDVQTSLAQRAVVGELCPTCAASDFHSAALAETQADFGVNRGLAHTSFGAAGTDNRGSGQSASVSILTAAESRSLWRDAWTFTADGHFSGSVLLDGHSDVATGTFTFPSTFAHGASGGFADWFYQLMVWDMDNLSPGEDGFIGPTLVTSILVNGNDEQRPSFESEQALDFDFLSGVHYVVIAELGVTGRNGHSLDLFHTAQLTDISLSGGANLNALSGHDYFAVPEPDVWVLVLSSLVLSGLCRRQAARARSPV